MISAAQARGQTEATADGYVAAKLAVLEEEIDKASLGSHVEIRTLCPASQSGALIAALQHHGYVVNKIPSESTRYRHTLSIDWARRDK